MLVEKHEAEKNTKHAVIELQDMKLQLNEALRSLIDSNNSRQKILDEKNHLANQVDEKELLMSQLQQIQASLKNQLDNAIKLGDHEARVGFIYYWNIPLIL